MIGELCEVCGIGRRVARRIREALLEGEGVVVVENVPAEVCSHCEETTLTAETVGRLEALLAGAAAPVAVLAAPLYRYPDAADAPVGAQRADEPGKQP